MKNQVCTEEQMILLKMLGVDDSKASMCRIEVHICSKASDDSLLVENNDYFGNKLPFFTIADMLDRMPSEINGYDLIIYKSTDGWFAGYINYESSNLLYNLGAKCFILRDAVYLIFNELAKLGKLIEK